MKSNQCHLNEKCTDEFGPELLKKFRRAGIHNIFELSELVKTKQQWILHGKTVGVSAKLINTCVLIADMTRILGINQKYAELLYLADIDTVQKLAQQNVETLASILADIDMLLVVSYCLFDYSEVGGGINKGEPLLAYTLPSYSEIQKWIERANEFVAENIK